MISLGCAKNLVDSEILIGGLKQENYEMVKKSSKDKSIDQLLELYKDNPENLNNILKLSNKYFVEKKNRRSIKFATTPLCKI